MRARAVLLAHGEAVLRVAPKFTVRERGVTREPASPTSSTPSRSARAALREGLDTLPVASWLAPSSTFVCWSITAND